MKPFYYLCDFPERKNAGKNFVTECPKCGKKHLYISKETGAFHCFYGGCDFKGKLKDFWEERNNYDPASAGIGSGKFADATSGTITLPVSASTVPARKEKPEAEIPHPRYP